MDEFNEKEVDLALKGQNLVAKRCISIAVYCLSCTQIPLFLQVPIVCEKGMWNTVKVCSYKSLKM